MAKVDLTTVPDISEDQKTIDLVSMTDYSKIVLSCTKKQKRESEKFSDIAGSYLSSVRNMSSLSDLMNIELIRVFESSGKSEYNIVLKQFQNCVNDITGDTKDKNGNDIKGKRAVKYGYTGQKMAFKGAGGKVVEAVTDPKGQTGYKVQSIQIRAERQVDSQDKTESESGDSFEYLERAMLVAITKIDKGEWSKLDPAMATTLEEMLDACRSTPILDVNKKAA
jgi:hypothetical protein